MSRYNVKAGPFHGASLEVYRVRSVSIGKIKTEKIVSFLGLFSHFLIALLLHQSDKDAQLDL